MTHPIHLARLASVVTVLVSLSACVGAQNPASQEMLEQGFAYVEAFIEFAGPEARWAGPQSFILHVDARDGTRAKIELTPSPFRKAVQRKAPTDGSIVERTLASAGQGPSDTVRDRLADLAAMLDSPDRSFRGCLSPVRVRLIRSDGAVTERQGCRSQISWTRTASRIFSDFLSMAIDGQVPRRVPSSEQKTEPKKDTGAPWIQTESLRLDLNARYSHATSPIAEKKPIHG